MCFIIVFKWWINYSDPSTAPLLLNVMIDMLLNFWSFSDKDYLYDGQEAVQVTLLFLALLAVPVLLFFKPCFLRYKNSKRTHQPLHEVSPDALEDHESEPLTKAHNSEHSGGHGGGHGGGHEEFEFGEIMIHQIIHTIEFILGAISNTASYLRLWALSLAHSQLAQVFWEMVFLRAIEYENFVMVWLGFGAWGGATLGVLLGMESLSAFLHALRLHWVEFQNKFYLGDGKAFLPFSYELILKADPQASSDTK